jgi:8-oxo-dGTP diphosphatase
MAPIRVVAAIIEEDGRYLMTKRAEGKRRAGEWEFPGGTVKPDETHRKALEREILEEIGLVVEAGEEFSRSDHTYPGGFEVDLTAYSCRYVSGRIRLDREEVSDYAYISPRIMHVYPILAGDQFIVEKLLEKTRQAKQSSQ